MFNFPSLDTNPELKGIHDHLIVHASATPASLDIDTDWIDRVHRQKGWSGCGYHIVITRDGTVQWTGTGHRTRHIGQPGSHVGGCGPGWNRRSIGVCMAGGVKEDGKTPEDNFTDAQYDSLWNVIQELCANLDIPQENVMGHRDLIKLTHAAPKACPCFSVSQFLADRQKHINKHDYDLLPYKWDKESRPPGSKDEKLLFGKQHIVQPGDTLWSIANVTGVPIKDIRRLNNIKNDLIFPGQKLRLMR